MSIIVQEGERERAPLSYISYYMIFPGHGTARFTGMPYFGATTSPPGAKGGREHSKILGLFEQANRNIDRGTFYTREIIVNNKKYFLFFLIRK